MGGAMSGSEDSGRSLLVRRGGGQWSAPTVTSYREEAALRDMLVAEPTLLPGVGERCAAVAEFPVRGVGSLDVLAIDQGGSITLVECKLRSNPEIRRQVVGQALAYAAGLWRSTLPALEASWSARHRRRRTLVQSVLGEDHPQEEADALRTMCSDALRDGRFSLVFAVDAITDELRLIVEYLNAHTSTDLGVLALELGYAREGDLEIAVPRVFGAELAEARTRRRAKWTEDDVIGALHAASPRASASVRRILDHFRDRSRFYFGEGRFPSVTLVFEEAQGRFQPLSVWADKRPLLSTNFEWTSALPQQARRRYVERIAAIAGTGVDPEAVATAGFAKRPSFPIDDVLSRGDALNRLLAALDELVGARSEEQPRAGSGNQDVR